MPIDNVRELDQPAPSRDELDEIKRQAFKRYVSPYVSIDGGESYSYAHGLGDIPHLVSVLEATDSQGTGVAMASDVTVTNTVTLVTVENTGAARYFRVRAF